jgi:hypothetical protein
VVGGGALARQGTRRGREQSKTMPLWDVGSGHLAWLEPEEVLILTRSRLRYEAMGVHALLIIGIVVSALRSPRALTPKSWRVVCTGHKDHG